MGLIQTKVTLRNSRFPEIQPMEVEALVDRGAVTMCVPEHVALQLRLDEVEKREATFADGRRQSVSYSGPL
jgi:hypothetical protein